MERMKMDLPDCGEVSMVLRDVYRTGLGSVGRSTYGVGYTLAFRVGGELCWLTAGGDWRRSEGSLEGDGHGEGIELCSGGATVLYSSCKQEKVLIGNSGVYAAEVFRIHSRS